MKFYRSRSFCDLDLRSHVSCLSTFSKGSSSETTGSILLAHLYEVKGCLRDTTSAHPHACVIAGAHDQNVQFCA